MTKREIRELREKIGTDPILTDEEIEHIWTAMDKAEPMKPIKDKYGDCDCPICNASVEFSGVNTYSKHGLCPSCGQAIDWEEQMRDILFRGKRIDNGEWVYGNLIRRNVCGEEWEVIPETVGQYTGLDDKYGGKIFGGDIVMVNGDADDCGEVLWDEDDLCYEININGWLTRLGEYCSRELEVIDNPEFLEVNNVKP